MIINPNGQQPPAPKQIDFTKTTDLTCECGNDIFMPMMKFKNLSAIASPNGKAGIIPVEVYVCSACGKIPEALDFKG